MTDRIDQYLDGTLDRAALTPEEQRQADAAARAIEGARQFVTGAGLPDLVAPVMRRVVQLEVLPAAPAPRGVWTRVVAGLWSPRRMAFQVRPAYGIAAVVAAGCLMVLSGGRPAPVAFDTSASTAAALRYFVQFRLDAGDASDVRLAGSFTGWQPTHELHQASAGVWTITLPLAVGVHDYAFVVDGERWVADPFAPQVEDGFGGSNSRIALLAPEPLRP